MLLAAAWVPALGFLVAAKPNVGLASLAALDRHGVLLAGAGCVAAFVLSFVVQPGWVMSWREAIRTAPHIQSAALLLPAGPLLLTAAARWKRPEALLFLALVILPHTPSLYDLLLLFFACRTFRETVGLAVLTQTLYWGIVLFGSFNTFDAYAEGLACHGADLYLPVLIAILLRRIVRTMRRSPVVSPGARASIFRPTGSMPSCFRCSSSRARCSSGSRS
jgi:hypothetical protein